MERDLRFRAEGDVVRHTGLAATIRVQGPVLGQIEPVGDGQAGGMVGDRQGNSDLAVVLLAKLPTVLTGDADRMLALFRKASVVDYPGLDRAMTLDRRQDLIAYRAHHALVRPASLTHEVQQGLMLSRRSTGAVMAASGSTLLRSTGISRPRQ